MSIKDLTNNIEIRLAFNELITTNTTTFSTGIDISDFDGGFSFIGFGQAHMDGTYTVTLQDSPDNSVWTDIPSEKLNDPSGTGEIVIDSTQVFFDGLSRLGAFSTDAFVRAKIVSTGVSTGSDTTLYLLRVPEIMPATSL